MLFFSREAPTGAFFYFWNHAPAHKKNADRFQSAFSRNFVIQLFPAPAPAEGSPRRKAFPAQYRSRRSTPQYDTILVGFPIWWYVEPRIVDTFLERYDFSGKTMIPFATSGGSGIERVAQSLQAHCPSAEWQPGKLVNPANAAAWAKSL